MTEERADSCDLLCLDLPHAEEIRAGLPPLREVEPAALRAKALGDPTRLTIATALLSGDELCVCDMAWVVGQAQNLVSHHLRQLKYAGLVTSRRDGKLVMYALSVQGKALVSAILGDTVTEGGRHV
ncbi:metalloregulator ArsR/SmtB family transcription factor [Kibdelosporangium philippinense]|uniref:Metalloregulator ArsR/SmtB family transcription factor n=1 Tax=Kibdelosporangium philippinense TaxID=211113 RepID=A0ABS8Z9N3_9PSEU|nr:metalloregulator ArsR/SmtB family transcription factor [Kibdelosporangium philippinense]MCE7004589.1 metalloregulator ArsR/SmtB family transcription factor [Kibdelosporangium philippinense]